MTDLSNIVDAMGKARVMVVGDIMLDVFIYGDAKRISPEGPVPVLTISRENRMLGGAGNVLSNLAGLGVKPSIFTVVGDDAEGRQVRDLASGMGADIDGIIIDATRPTTVKTRFLATGQQLLRSDFEKTHALSPDILDQLMAAFLKTLPHVQAVVLSDYGKGVLSRDLIQGMIDSAHKVGLPVLVDPKGLDYSMYKGADIVTPNRKELSEATAGLPATSDAEIVAACEKLIATSGITQIVATRSEDGMSVVGQGDPLHLSTQVREVFDVSGAGDTVIATIAAAMACGAGLKDAAVLANLAGGIVVGKVGTTPIRADELKHAVHSGIETSGDTYHPRITRDWKAAREIADQWRAQGLKVGFTGGCFDILHFGHVTYLNEARDRCDRLIVGLNHDVSVKILKGPERPVNDESARAAVIGSLGAVDMVVFFGAEKAGDDNTPSAMLSVVQPDIYFKGGDYKAENLPEAETILAYGGKIQIMNLQEGFSTTSTIEKMRRTQ